MSLVHWNGGCKCTRLLCCLVVAIAAVAIGDCDTLRGGFRGNGEVADGEFIAVAMELCCDGGFCDETCAIEKGWLSFMISDYAPGCDGPVDRDEDEEKVDRDYGKAYVGGHGGCRGGWGRALWKSGDMVFVEVESCVAERRASAYLRTCSRRIS